MLRWCLIALLLFTVPTWATGGGTLSNPDTGIAGVYSGQARISAHPHHVLMGHVIIVTRGEETVHALVIRHRFDGVHRLHIREAWVGGMRLLWRRETGLGCTHGHCRDRAVGMILLSRALFDRARVHGLNARLVGPSGAIDIAAPATLFQDAATRARDM